MEKIFNWKSLEDVQYHNVELKKELNSISYSNLEEIENLIHNKYVIEANSKLNYNTLLNEYYSNFGMNPKDFVEMMQLKYGCRIICPDKENQSTRIIVKN